MKKKKIFIMSFAVILLIIILLIYFYQNQAKLFKFGNNKSSQQIVDHILNINSYELKATVKVKSNKNENQYVLSQIYISPDQNSQEVLEPSNIAGTKIIRDNKNLKLENTALNLSNVFNNYQYIGDNCLDLSSFIKDYQEFDQSTYQEKENQVIMETQDINQGKNQKHKTLYIDKNTGNPTKLEIKDNNQKMKVYILYNEVKINSIDKGNMLAFQLYEILSDI